jgi:hypothetical protein
MQIVLHMNAARQPNLRTDETRASPAVGIRPGRKLVSVHFLKAKIGPKIGVSSFSQSEN